MKEINWPEITEPSLAACAEVDPAQIEPRGGLAGEGLTPKLESVFSDHRILESSVGTGFKMHDAYDLELSRCTQVRTENEHTLASGISEAVMCKAAPIASEVRSYVAQLIREPKVSRDRLQNVSLRPSVDIVRHTTGSRECL